MFECTITKSLEYVSGVSKIYILGNRKYIKYIKADEINTILPDVQKVVLDGYNFAELKRKVSEYGTDAILVMVLPLWVEGSSREEIFNWLMELEEEERYIINISVGIEGTDIDEKTEKILVKLLSKIINADSTKIAKNNSYYSEMLKDNEKMIINDSNGSRIIFEIDKVLLENDYLEPENKVIQIPAGEVFVIPKKGSVNGVLVLQEKKGNRSIEIINDFADLSFINEEYYLPVGEIGFGTNPQIPEIWSLPFMEKNMGHFIWDLEIIRILAANISTVYILILYPIRKNLM